jgi:hypothetical protein
MPSYLQHFDQQLPCLLPDAMQARNLAALRPAIEAAGYKLVVVSIGYPQAGREFCEKLPFPPGG